MKNVLKTVSGVGLGLALLTGPALAKDVTETRDVAGFTKIKVDGLANMNIEVGKDFSISVEGDEKVIRALRTRLRGKTLSIDLDGYEDDRKVLNIFDLSDLKAKIHITMPSIEGFETDGLIDAVITNIDSEDFYLEIDGKADVELTGKCVNTEIEIDGWADLDAREFKCENVVIELDGMGDADVFASKSVRASADGMGDITVYGKPEKTKVDEDGFASVKIRK